ncbi:hypothetical protein SSPS47_16470 [Streptomyces sp. S4.7]|uniref:hypothetical protein n=1 Tax=Streptomyces sp. S4.7 TaxID=2705439 RepID=UPI001396F767|nr:hypothetical protein [Streptomyces sp. S4.7]QHY96702.1 hypothetical protein SSPS47_16470 [Streptomyces sp. S4.7]
MSSQSHAQSQGSHFFVLTVEKPGLASATSSGSYTPPAGATRLDAFNTHYAELTGSAPALQRANVVFFSLEPNQV